MGGKRPSDLEKAQRAAINARDVTIASLIGELEALRRFAGHAVHDLQMLGVPVEKMLDITPDILAAADEHARESTAYS